MKSDTTTTVLNFVLAVLVILGVVFALLAMTRTRHFRALSPYAIQANSKIMMCRSLVNDVEAYNKQAKSPEITKMLQSLQPKTAAQ
jgi:multisubunit Na+/H+ antiporter MnhB subunit